MLPSSKIGRRLCGTLPEALSNDVIQNLAQLIRGTLSHNELRTDIFERRVDDVGWSEIKFDLEDVCVRAQAI